MSPALIQKCLERIISNKMYNEKNNNINNLERITVKNAKYKVFYNWF